MKEMKENKNTIILAFFFVFGGFFFAVSSLFFKIIGL